MFNTLRQHLFTPPQQHPFAQGELSPGQRIYAVGDIHGRADLLVDLLKKIRTDLAFFKGEVTLVILGDVIDHGTWSASVVEVLTTQIPTAWNTVFLRGNHEWAMQNFLADPTRSEWLGWGGDATLASYGVRLYDNSHHQRPLPAVAAELAEAIAAHGHDAFYANLHNYWRHQGYAFVHAGVRRGLDWDDQLETDLLMMQGSQFTRGHNMPERIVFGHTIYKTPVVTEQHIGIDTGARESDILTAVVLEQKSFRFIQTK
jgi:serine/threonine protein phosphatase 1